jgi:hypothetical protein
MATIKERVYRSEQDIASTIAIFNSLAPALGGPNQDKQGYTVTKGTIDMSAIAQRTDTLDATRAWLPDIPLRVMDVILVGPQRRVVQVTDLADIGDMTHI